MDFCENSQTTLILDGCGKKVKQQNARQKLTGVEHTLRQSWG
jgi:hypothetical protein